MGMVFFWWNVLCGVIPSTCYLLSGLGIGGFEMSVINQLSTCVGGRSLLLDR